MGFHSILWVGDEDDKHLIKEKQVRASKTKDKQFYAYSSNWMLDSLSVLWMKTCRFVTFCFFGLHFNNNETQKNWQLTRQNAFSSSFISIVDTFDFDISFLIFVSIFTI